MKASWKVLLIYTFFVIVWGAFVRASGSGDGCGAHWPSCHGEYLLDSLTTKTLIEYTHRASSGLYGIFVFLLSIITIASSRFSKTAKIFSAGVLFLTIVEALIGAKLVLSELVGQNTSNARAIVMITHLTNTLLLVACNVGVIFFAEKRTKFLSAIQLKEVFKVWGPIVLLFFLTGASGALAALGDSLYPAESLLEGFAMDFDPNSPIIIRLRSLHPLFAFGLTGMVLWFADPQKPTGAPLMAIALLTLVVGLINLSLMAPLYLQLGHLTIALSFWVVTLTYFFQRTTQDAL